MKPFSEASTSRAPTPCNVVDSTKCPAVPVLVTVHSNPFTGPLGFISTRYTGNGAKT